MHYPGGFVIIKELMLKQKLKNRVNFRFFAAITLAVVLSSAVFGSFARADQFDEQIKQLQAQNRDNRSQASQWAGQASSYQDAVNRLEEEIRSLQQSIVDNQRKSDELQQQINEAQAELDHQRAVLGINIKTMYIEGQITTLEILASSKDLSEFVDKEQSRVAVQNKIKTTVDKITQLKLQLQEQQRELAGRIKDLQNQQAQKNDAQNQQAQLLAYSEGQKATFEQAIKSNNSQISALRAQQLAANRRLSGGASVIAGDPNHGGYPSNWNDAPQDSLIDTWGMFNRECVSYTAWKVYETYGYMPYWGGHGNANQWPASAQADGIPTGSTPKANSVAISMGGFYGHSMWVEAVDGNMIRVSQYNYDLAGHYSEMTIDGSGLTYIYFQ